MGKDDMTLRDWFAGEAMAAAMLNKRPSTDLERLELAEEAFKMADALMAERKKR